MFKRIIRRDGSVIILLPKKDTQAITFQVLYKVGSRQEDVKNNGVSHFVEHLMFKGTKKRPNTAAIAKELDGIGAEYNAFTGKEHTGYYITADNNHVGLATEMISDMIFHSKFEAVEMNKERGVIIEEINMYEDNPLMHIEDVFENLIFKGTILGRSIAGPRSNIRNISRQALYNYYKKYYYSGNSIIGLAGKFDTKRALALINKYFPVGRRQTRAKLHRVPVVKQKQPRIDIVKREAEQVQLMLGFRNVAVTDKNFLPSQVLVNILGGTMSSRLFLEIREKRGLCYFIKSVGQGYEDISYLAVHAGLNKAKIYEALIVIKEELEKIRQHGVTQKELDKAKANIRGRMIIRLEEAHDYINFLADQELMGMKIKDLQEKLKEMDKISLSQINGLIGKIINWRQANLAIIGPFTNNHKFLKILKK